MSTPKTWPDNAWPTPEQYLHWSRRASAMRRRLRIVRRLPAAATEVPRVLVGAVLDWLFWPRCPICRDRTSFLEAHVHANHSEPAPEPQP